jgi:TonB-linked SusC/RagA family outer membrane protein
MLQNLQKILLVTLISIVGWIPTTSAQQTQVTGRVLDARHQPIPGVNILVAQTNIGTTTNEDGRFSLQVPASEAKLVASSVGFERQEILLQGRTTLEIILADSPNALNEMVVVGFGTQKKVNLTGAVDQVNAQQLENRPIPNLGAGLQGLIPNLNITVPSGQPGSSPSFNIRGFTSINGGSPLLLVDNVPFTPEELSRINPSDVESVSVLKDASSAAVYGARAAFGVVLITTKKANSSKLAVSVNANLALRTIGRAPSIATDPYTVMDVKHQAAYPLYSLFPEAVREYARQRSADPSLPAVTVDPANANKWIYTGATDWMNEAYRSSAPTYNTSVNLSQKLEKLGYYLSGDFYQQNGILRYGNDNFKRYNFRAKVDLQVTPWLTLANNTQLTSSQYDASVFMPQNDNGALFFHNVNRTSPLDVPKNPDGTWTSAGASVFGRLQDGGRSNTGLNEFVTTFSVNASVIKNLWDVRADATIRRSAQLARSFDIPIAYRTGPNQPLQYSGSTTSYASNANRRIDYNVLNVYTDVHKQLGNHYLQALAGFNQEYNNTNSYTASRNNLISTTLPSINLSTGTMTETESITDWAVRGLFYRLNYNFKERYLVELNGRYDGSSRFPKNDRWGFFPSASAGWLISEEPFMTGFKQSARLDLFKLRASYGALGNQASVGAYDYIPTMSAGNLNELLGGAIPVLVNQPAAVASSLTWEQVSTVNFGADLAFFDNRLQLSFDKYTRYTKDMLIPGKVLPGVFGVASPKANAGDLKTKGWELKIGWRDNKVLAGSPLTYNVSFGLGDSRSWITRFDNPTRLLSSYYEGQEIGEIWGLDVAGFFQSEDEVKNHPDQKAVGTGYHGYLFTPGDIKFNDRNGDGVVDRGKQTVDAPGDLHKIGNSRPRLPFNLDLSGSWKGFDARVFLQGIAQQDWYPGGGNFYFWGIYAQPWTNVTTLNLDHWTPENPNAYFPRIKSYTAETANSELGIPNTRYIQNAAYLRVKNLMVGYTLPGSLTKRVKLDRVRFYFSAENLFDVSFIKGGLDPEGLNAPNYLYPFQKTYSWGLNFNF